MIAALYVETNGCYFGLDNVDPWDKERDARNYAGPHPVVAHPPCERWGRYFSGGPTWIKHGREPKKRGDDNGCFDAALQSVRRFSGVLEHPEASSAWAHFSLLPPLRGGGWSVADWQGGWTCCIEQGAYGHRARKATWLYANGCDLPSLKWGKAKGTFLRVDAGFRSTEERRRAVKTGIVHTLGKRERAATPIPFRDLLISIAESANQRVAA